MMNKQITIMLYLLLAGAGGGLMAQQGFGTSAPDPSAVVEMKAANKGLLIPRVALTATNVAAPVTSPGPAVNLLVFNIQASSPSPATAVFPGFYFWNGAAWVRLLNKDDLSLVTGLSTTGNAGSTVTIGTLDNNDLVVKTNSVDRLHITAGGLVGVGTATPDPSALLELKSNTKGFLPPRITNGTDISSPVAGLVVYDATRKCLAYYNGTTFKCFSGQ